MPQGLPLWALLVIIGLALLAVAFFFAWMSERKVLKEWKASHRDYSTVIAEARDALLGAFPHCVEMTLPGIARIASDAIANYRFAVDAYTSKNKALTGQLNNVKAFVRDRSLTLRPKKGKLFIPFNEPELEKVMNGEEII